ncbi:MAG: hypothetical protein ACOYXU_10295 [Nitrospirota bacterium]
MSRSLAAVVIGYVALAGAAAAKFFAIKRFLPEILPAPGEDVFPDTAWLLTVLASDLALMIGAGYVTAVIARRAPIAHTVALGAVIAVFGLIWMFVFWGWMPLWYQVVLFSIALPAAATGGALRSQPGSAPS